MNDEVVAIYFDYENPKCGAELLLKSHHPVVEYPPISEVQQHDGSIGFKCHDFLIHIDRLFMDVHLPSTHNSS